MKLTHCISFTVFSLLIITLCISPPTQAQYTANGDGFPMVSPISINSPSNSTYTTNQVTLSFTVKSLVNNTQGSATMTYSLDGKDNVTIPTSIEFVPVEATVTDANGKQKIEVSQFASYYIISGSVVLTDLQAGQHSLTVFGRYTVYSMSGKVGLDSQTVYFTMDDGSLPVASSMGVSEVMHTHEPSDNTFYYMVIGIFSIVTIAVCALFVKLGSRDKIVNSSSVTSISQLIITSNEQSRLYCKGE